LGLYRWTPPPPPPPPEEGGEGAPGPDASRGKKGSAFKKPFPTRGPSPYLVAWTNWKDALPASLHLDQRPPGHPLLPKKTKPKKCNGINATDSAGRQRPNSGAVGLGRTKPETPIISMAVVP